MRRPSLLLKSQPWTRQAGICSLVLLTCFAASAPAGIVGFGDGSDWTLNGNQASVDAGLPAIAGDELQITAVAEGLSSSAFYNTKQDITQFVAEFDYSMVDSTETPADEWSFILQNNAPTAMGDRGFTGLAKSVAVRANIWQASDLYLGQNGGYVGGISTLPTIDFRNGNTVRTKVRYYDNVAYIDLEDLATGEMFSTSYNVDIPALVGDTTAYVGFGGGTGGASADQRITNFTMDPMAVLTWDGAGDGSWNSTTQWTGGPAGATPSGDSPVTIKTNTVSVTENAGAFALGVNSGGLSINDARLSVFGAAQFAAGTTLALNNGTLASDGATFDHVLTSGTSAISVNKNVPIASLTVSDGTFAKQGSGTLMLDNTSGTGVMAVGGALRVEGGVLETTGTDPFGGSTAIELAGGTLSIDGGGFGAGDINGFGDGTGWTLSGNANSTAAGVPNINDGVLQLNTRTNDQASNAFFNEPQDITEFRVEFDYTNVGGPDPRPADEWQFIVQGNDANATGGRGYTGMGRSAAVRVDVWNGSLLALGTNGAYGASTDTKPAVDVRNSNPIHATVVYDGSVLSVDLQDTITHASYSAEYAVDIPSLVGGDTAYMGFGGGTGGASMHHQLENVTNNFPAFPIEQGNTSVTVSANSTLNPVTHLPANFGTLTMEGGILTTTGAAKGGVHFAGTNIAPSATAVGFDPQVPTSYGPIDAGDAEVVISKHGGETWTLDTQPTNLHANSSFVVNDGTFDLQADDALAGQPLTISGGKTTMVGGQKLGSSPVTLDGGELYISDGRGGFGGTIDGIGDASLWTLSGNANAQGAGVPNVVDEVLTISTATSDLGTNAFLNEKQDVRAFRVEFDYTNKTDPGATPADEWSFIVQNGPDGAATLSTGRGYQNIPKSAAMRVNIWQASDVHLGTGGGWGGATSTLPGIDFRSRNTIHTTLIYDGAKLDIHAEDTATGGTFQTSYDVDIPGLLGDDMGISGSGPERGARRLSLKSRT